MKELLNYMKKVDVDTVYTLVNWRDWGLLRFFDIMGFKRGDMINLDIVRNDQVVNLQVTLGESQQR